MINQDQQENLSLNGILNRSQYWCVCQDPIHLEGDNGEIQAVENVEILEAPEQRDGPELGKAELETKRGVSWGEITVVNFEPTAPTLKVGKRNKIEGTGRREVLEKLQEKLRANKNTALRSVHPFKKMKQKRVQSEAAKSSMRSCIKAGKNGEYVGPTDLDYLLNDLRRLKSVFLPDQQSETAY